MAHWKEFSFLPQWGSMAAAAKLDKLRRYACHELHLFVHQRDPDLFRSAVLPMLQVKLHGAHVATAHSNACASRHLLSTVFLSTSFTSVHETTGALAKGLCIVTKLFTGSLEF